MRNFLTLKWILKLFSCSRYTGEYSHENVRTGEKVEEHHNGNANSLDDKNDTLICIDTSWNRAVAALVCAGVYTALAATSNSSSERLVYNHMA